MEIKLDEKADTWANEQKEELRECTKIGGSLDLILSRGSVFFFRYYILEESQRDSS